MNKIRNFLFVLIVLSGCAGNNGRSGGEAKDIAGETGEAVITFNNYEHDFGKISEGEHVGCFFKFTNTGTSDLVVASASASCGCTVPKYDVKPIPPGASGSMEVIFDATGRSGFQTKTITVKSNAVNPVVILKISADII